MILSQRQIKALVWWIDWTNETMRDRTADGEAMVRSGEITLKQHLCWKNMMFEVKKLHSDLKRVDAGQTK